MDHSAKAYNPRHPERTLLYRTVFWFSSVEFFALS